MAKSSTHKKDQSFKTKKIFTSRQHNTTTLRPVYTDVGQLKLVRKISKSGLCTYLKESLTFVKKNKRRESPIKFMIKTLRKSVR